MANEFNIRNGFISKSGSTVQSYLNVSGNTTSPAFITVDGLNNQFVKGDGTLDSTAFSTQTLTLGTDNQIPVMNSGGTDFEYTSDFIYDGTDVVQVAFNVFQGYRLSETAGQYIGGYYGYDGANNRLEVGTHNATDATRGNDVAAFTIARGSTTVGFLGTVSTPNLTLTSLSNQASEATALMINGSSVVGTRELGSNAFNSTAFSTGTGTTNYVSKWTSTTAQGNSLIYDDGTDVGIGTTSPNAKLSISRTSGFSSIKAIDDGFMMIDSNGSQIRLNNYVADDISLVAGGGDVGIGNSNPLYKLDVTGTGRFTGDLTLDGNIDTPATFRFKNKC
jgi:hypothetical protein